MKSIETGVLWKKTDRNGKTYLTGTMNIFPFGSVNITIFENGYKTKDNQPDYKIFYSPTGEDSKGIDRSDDGNIPF